MDVQRGETGWHHRIRSGDECDEPREGDCAVSMSLAEGPWQRGCGAIPGHGKGWKSSHSDIFQEILAKMEIFVSLHPEECGDGRSFNVADGATATWGKVWPGLCAYFGLKGEGPAEGAQKSSIQGFVKDNKEAWAKIVEGRS